MIKKTFPLVVSIFTFFQVFSFCDYYIDRLTGESLGFDGAENNNLRVINIRERNYVIEEKGGSYSPTGILEFHKNSYLISFDENQIQKEVQKIADDTMRERLENQVFIVLNVNNGRVFAIRDWIPELKTNKEIVINTYTVGYNGAPRVGEGLMLLGQLHGNPQEIKDNLRRNIRTVSEFDVDAAKELGVTIFAADAFDSFDLYESKDSVKLSRAFYIQGVEKNGNVKNFIGQTKGTNGQNTFNFSSYFELILRTSKNLDILQ